MAKRASDVYVVDDDPGTRKLVTDILETVGINAVTFASAREFLASDLPSRPSCVLLDNRMPEISGLEMQKTIAAREPAIAVVFMSGHRDVVASVRAMKAGAHDFLVKPFTPQDLIDAVHGALRHSREMHREAAALARIRTRVRDLSVREREVFAWIVGGYANKRIADSLSLSERTIKVHRARVMEKMGADSLPDLVRMAMRIGIAGPDDLPAIDDPA